MCVRAPARGRAGGADHLWSTVVLCSDHNGVGPGIKTPVVPPRVL